MILTWRRRRGSPSTTLYTQTLHTHTPGSAAHLLVSACNTHKPSSSSSSSSVLKLSQTSPSHHSHALDLQHGLLFAHVDRLQVSPLHRIVFLLLNRHLAARALATVAEVPQHSRSRDGQQQQREPRAWGHLTQETLSYPHCITSHLYTEYMLTSSTRVSPSLKVRKRMLSRTQLSRENSGILHLKTQRAEHWRHAAASITQRHKQSLLMRVTWHSLLKHRQKLSVQSVIITGRLSPEQGPQHLQRVCDRLQEDGHPLEADHHVQQVKGQRSGAAQIRAAVYGGRVFSGQLGQFGPVPLACVGSWGEEAVHCMLGNQRST